MYDMSPRFQPTGKIEVYGSVCLWCWQHPAKFWSSCLLSDIVLFCSLSLSIFLFKVLHVIWDTNTRIRNFILLFVPEVTVLYGNWAFLSSPCLDNTNSFLGDYNCLRKFYVSNWLFYFIFKKSLVDQFN